MYNIYLQNVAKKKKSYKKKPSALKLCLNKVLHEMYFHHWSVINATFCFPPPLHQSLPLDSNHHPVFSSLQAHEFVDEQVYEQNCLERALQTYASRSPSISSHDSSEGTCCGRRGKRNTPLPNASLPSSHQGPLQELSAIHIQCGEPPSHAAR